MSVAPCVLLSAAKFGGSSEARLPAVSGSKIQKRPEPRSLHFQEIFPEFAGPKYRTQKNALDATCVLHVPNLLLRTTKARNDLSPNDPREI
jgi:hypothetical protein